MSEFVAVVGFDLAWGSPTGWAFLRFDREGYCKYETGVIKARRAIKTEEDKALRALNLVVGIEEVLGRYEVAFGTRVFICYEDPLKWLLAASRQRRKRRPITRDSLMAGAFCVNCFHVAVGLHMKRVKPLPGELEVLAVDTQSARSKFGVHDLTKLDEPLIDKYAAMRGYADRKKACIGAALEKRLGMEPGLENPCVPATDHEADAAVFAFVVGDQERLWLMRGL